MDNILAGSPLGLDQVGVRLSEERQVEAPAFEHLDELGFAPVGADLGEKHDVPPPIVPDVSHLSDWLTINRA